MTVKRSVADDRIPPDRPYRTARSGLVGLALCAALGGVGHASQTPPEVRIDTGALVGVQAPGVAVFRGIPYAAPPLGPLRWKPPAPARPWTGVRDASAYGAACPQDDAHQEAWAQVGRKSEDCLTLNVWSPDGARKAAVMVFLHGGGFTYGAAGAPLYDGANLARRGVVIVTLNYRLGRLGFFAHPALTAEDPHGRLGNFGVMDQIEALRWVRRNIAKFGGDPANVTIFGESAGAGAVQLLMGSDEAKGLFAKAISESGAGGTPLPDIRSGPGNAEAQGVKWAQSVGLAHPTAADLRAQPVEAVLGRAFPFIDGAVVRFSPGAPFHAGVEAKAPLIIGSNSGEASLTSNTDAIAKMALGPAYPEFLEAYRKRPGVPAENAARDLREDVDSVQESNFLADMHAAHGAATYAYYFDEVPFGDRAKGLGAEHGGELQYLFGNEPADQPWDDTDRRVSKLMGDYWVRFAKTGDPNGAGAPIWPAVKGRPTVRLVFRAATAAAPSTELEEQVKAATLATVLKLWAAQAKP